MVTRMRPFTSTISLEEARALIDAHVRPIDRTARVRLEEAHGRVLAGDVIAAADVPPFSRAAMDGYAVVAADTAGASRQTPRTLSCVEQVFTAQLATQRLESGRCTEIATGAPMPPGADAVVMVEETEADAAGIVRVFAPVTAGQNVGRQGADIQAGQAVLRDGELLNPSRVGALAAIGRSQVDVYERPRVAILSTGNEVADPGQPLAPGQIYDVNRFTVAGVVAESGGTAILHGTAADSLDDLARAIDACAQEDVLVFSGGSSVGERDLILDVVRARGELVFHGIAVKPGKPMAFGTIGGRLFFGLPGYPASCLSNAYIFLAPALRRIARLPARASRCMTVPLGRRVASVAGRHQFYTVRLADGVAVPAFKASGDITSMSQADGYIEIAADTEALEQGDLVEVTLF